MVKVSDYIMKYLASIGIKQVFCVTGGGAMHMNNSLGENPNLEGVFMLHEQGASIAAEAAARATDGFGCCLVTSGPGATNALTGLVGAYIDSIPVIFLAGQAKRADLVGDQQIRQFGIQEVDSIKLAAPYSKYAVRVDDAESIRYELEKASAIAKNGRPGPVWLEIPLDIQASVVDESILKGYDSSKFPTYEANDNQIDETIELLNKSERPVIILGHGIRLSGAIEDARKLYETLGIPVLTSWNGVDLIEDCHPLYYGRPGGVGQRAANIIMQSADFVLTLGTRLNLLATGYNFEGFLKRATHVMVDIDEHEMNKKSVHPQFKVQADVGSFINKMLLRADRVKELDRSAWIEKCDSLIAEFPNYLPESYPRENYISTYDLVSEVSEQMKENDIYQFTSSGTSVDIAMKMFKIKWGQRAFLTKGLAAMGYDIPASIGSCVSTGRRTVCITGDGSFAMNIQELEVIKRLNLPVKLFVVDNNGYSMIYQSQFANFNGNLTGCTDESGLSLPDMGKVAEAFDIKSMLIEEENELHNVVKDAFEYDGPVVCVVKTDITQKILPKQSNYVNKEGQMESRPLEDMVPLVSCLERYLD